MVFQSFFYIQEDCHCCILFTGPLDARVHSGVKILILKSTHLLTSIETGSSSHLKHITYTNVVEDK